MWYFTAMDWLGGAPCIHYPRWVRRAYIIAWPIAFPVRMALFMIGATVFIIGIVILWPIAWAHEKIADGLWELSRQWDAE